MLCLKKSWTGARLSPIPYAGMVWALAKRRQFLEFGRFSLGWGPDQCTRKIYFPIPSLGTAVLVQWLAGEVTRKPVRHVLLCECGCWVPLQGRPMPVKGRTHLSSSPVFARTWDWIAKKAPKNKKQKTRKYHHYSEGRICKGNKSFYILVPLIALPLAFGARHLCFHFLHSSANDVVIPGGGSLEVYTLWFIDINPEISDWPHVIYTPLPSMPKFMHLFL